MYQFSIVWNSQFLAEVEMCLQPCGGVEVVGGWMMFGRENWFGLVDGTGRSVRTAHHKAEIFSNLENLFSQNFAPRIITQCPKTTRIFRTRILLVGPPLIL